MPFSPSLPPGLINPLAPAGGGASIPPFPLQQGAAGDVLGAVGSAACGYISDPRARALCIALASAGAGLFGNSGSSTGTGTGTGGGLSAQSCPPGYRPDGRGGCVIQGLGSYLPGDVGMPDTGWNPVAGLYGVGVSPLPVQRQPTRVCPPGFALGKDGVCYDRIARSHRMHDPGTKPLLTGGDVSALRRAKSLQKKIGKLTTAYGKKKCSCSSRSSSSRKK